MQFFEVGSLIVFDGRQFVGILTERGLVRAMADGARATSVSVRRYMTEDPLVIEPEADSEDAIRMMLELGVRHLPVVEGKTLVGMVSIRDLMVEQRAAL
jgi:CBS domain-containing protein